MLDWPPGWPRTAPEDRKRGSFGQHRDTTWGTRKAAITHGAALTRLQDEIRRMDGYDLRIETGHSDGQLRQDGLPKAQSRTPEDPGVVVRFRRPGGQPMEFACDQYTRYEDNIAAVAKTLEAKRGVLRWGCATADREYQGYDALPATTTPSDPRVEEALQALEAAQAAGSDVRNSVRRRLLAKYHPDNQATGDADVFRAIKEAAIHG